MNAANGATMAPGWLERFRNSPAQALDDLLLGRAWLGALAGGDPAEALLDFARASDTDATFRTRLDEAIAGWLSAKLEKPPACHVGRWANAFRGALLAVEELGLRSAARLLSDDTEAWRAYLRSFYDGPPQDPESAYLRALAASQEDRELLGFWYSVCRLEPSLPLHFGLVGILGLRWLPGEKGGPPPDINPEVSQGLLLLGKALSPFGAEGETEFKRALRLTRAAYPRSPQTWAHLLNWEKEEKSEAWSKVNSWVNEAFPDILRIRLKQHFEGVRPNRAQVFHAPRWAGRAQQIAARLSSVSWASALREAEGLLSEELAYARATGHATYFVKSACNFSGRILGMDNNRAMRWTEEALRWEPYNPYTHTQYAACLKETGRLAEAEAILWEAVRRFPGNVVAHTGLAEVLKEQERLDDAEAEYRETKNRFPNNVIARTGLAEVLKAQGRFEEAETEFREAKRRFPTNVVARTGLAEVLKDQWRLVEAEAEYREAKSRFTVDAYCWLGLAGVLSAQGRFEEAEAEFRETKRRFPTNEAVPNALAAFLSAQRRPDEAEAEYRESLARPAPEKRQLTGSHVARCGLGHLLRRMARREAREGRAEQAAERRREAHALFQSVLQERPSDSYALSGEGFLLLDEGRLQEAIALFEDASRRYPGLDVFAYGLMRARRESGECLPEAAWDAMASRGQRIPTVARLEHARASLESGNLDAAGAQVRQLYEDFTRACRPREAGDGEVSTAEWYVQSLGSLLFHDAAQDALAAEPNIEEVVRRLCVASNEIDEITEQYTMAA